MAGEYFALRRLMEGLDEQHMGRLLWCLPSPEDPRDYKYFNLMGASISEAGVIDYRSSLPPVFDQGERGSCVACASAWTLKAYQEIREGDYPALGLSASFIYSMCKKVDGLPGQEGTTLRAALQVLRKVGVCKEELMPYNTLSDLPPPDTPEVSPKAVAAAGDFKIKSYARLCGYEDTERSQVIGMMRQALSQQGPFIMAFLVSENFLPDEAGMLPLPDGLPRGGHAVGIVGDWPEKEALIVRNSWGSSWGQDGYAYLPYDWVIRKFEGQWHVFEAWTAVDLAAAPPAARIVINPGQSLMLVDDQEVRLEKAQVNPELIRSLAEAMGYRVSWYGRELVLTRPY